MEHVLSVRYVGGLADQNRMDAADNHNADEGAKQLLAALAYAYCYGKIPRNKRTRTDLFYIHVTADRPGSFLISVVGGILGSAIYDAAKFTFREFALPVLQSWTARRYPVEPYGIRLQEALRRDDRGNSAFFDAEAYQLAFWEELYAALDDSAIRITRTLGRHADRAELAMDGTLVRTFDRRFYGDTELEAAIEEALLPIRARRDRLRFH